MEFLSKLKFLHLFVLLFIYFIGLYLIPQTFDNSLIDFAFSTFYFILTNILIIFWTVKYGIISSFPLKKIVKLPTRFSDYILIITIYLAVIIISFLMTILSKFQIFDFLNTNLQRPIELPSLDLVKKMPIFISCLILISSIISIISEELFFRAYLFEKQYIYLHNYTWIVNGLFWTVSHLFAKSNLFEFLPIALLYSLVYQKKRNIVITFIPHFMINSIPIFRYLMLIY